MEIINGYEHYNNIAVGENTADNIFDSSLITANPDGSVLERLEHIGASISTIVVADFIISDMDDFDVADADADTARWDPGYITGTEGGSADINTTTAGKLMVKVDPDATPTESRYAVSHSLPFYADFFTVTADMACTWGATASVDAKALGIIISAGAAYDANNYLALERQKGTSTNRFTVSGKLNNVAVTTTSVNTTDDIVALKISRYDNVWRFYYSTVQYPSEVWTLISQIEDPSVYMTNQVTMYFEAYSKGSADAESAQADFDTFRYLIGSGGGGQYIAGDYSSAWVAPDIDGNVLERQEALQKAINVTDAATLTGFEEDGTGANLFNTLIAKQSVTTGAGTTATFADTTRTEGADYWIGAKIVALSGSAAGQVRTIVDDSGAGTLTVEPLLAAAPGNSIAYIIFQQKGSDYILGDNTANNAYDSSNVVVNKDGSVLERLESLLSTVLAYGTFTTDSATVPADTGRGEGNDYWNGQLLIPLTGNCAFQPRLIVDFAITTGIFTLDPEHPFTTTPGAVTYVIVANDGQLVPGTDVATNYTSAHVIGNKADAIPAMNAVPANSSAIAHLKAILERLGATPADSDDSALTNIGQRDDAATSDDMSDITTTSMQAKLRLLLARLSADAFTATIQGSARTTLDAMTGAIAAYLSDSGAAYSSTIDPGGTARTCVETAIEDVCKVLSGGCITTFPTAADIATGVSLAGAIRAILTSIVGGDDYDGFTNISGSANTSLNAVAQKFAAVIGIDAANTFAPSMTSSPTTIEGAFASLQTTVGAEYDGSPDIYDTVVTGYDSSAIAANADGSIMERLEFVQSSMIPDTGGLSFKGPISTGGSLTSNKIASLAGYGDDYFNNLYYMQIINTTDDLAPVTEVRKITDYTSVDGTFVTDAFSVILTAADETIIFHESLAAAGRNDADNTIDTSTVAANEDGSILERLEHIQEALSKGTGTSVPANKSLYDIIGAAYVDGGGGLGTDSVLADLGLINTAVAAVNTDLGDFSAQTNLQSLLAALGIPDVAAKSFYTCLITDRLDNATYGLSAIETLVDDLETEVAKIPKSDAAVTWNATALASVNAEVDTALNTAVPASPTVGSLNDILSKAAAGNTFDKATDSLEAISDAITVGTHAGNLQIKSTTESLNQAAADWPLFTGTTQAVVLEKLNLKMPTGAAGGAITSISVQTDDATPGVIISSATGVIGNLTSEADLSWTGALLINVGTIINLTINGGAHGGAYTVTVVAQYRAVVAGGILAS